MHQDEQAKDEQAKDEQAKDDAEQLRAQESELQQEYDTSGLAGKLRQVQNEVESRELERTIRLDRARGHLDTAPADEQEAAGNGPSND